MKRFLLWSFERGSVQYDVICVVILAFIFIMPPAFFDDRPDTHPHLYDQAAIRSIRDDDGRVGWQVDNAKTEQDAVERLKAALGEAVIVSRTEPSYDTEGALVGYSIWVAR
jgi:hypothetical protein